MTTCDYCILLQSNSCNWWISTHIQWQCILKALHSMCHTYHCHTFHITPYYCTHSHCEWHQPESHQSLPWVFENSCWPDWSTNCDGRHATCRIWLVPYVMCVYFRQKISNSVSSEHRTANIKRGEYVNKRLWVQLHILRNHGTGPRYHFAGSPLSNFLVYWIST